jgi:hypothetical protein
LISGVSGQGVRELAGEILIAVREARGDEKRAAEPVQDWSP